MLFYQGPKIVQKTSPVLSDLTSVSGKNEYTPDFEQKTEISSIETSQAKCYKHTAGEDQNQFVRIASEISDGDVNFLALLDAENGMWTIDRRSSRKGSNGYYDFGFCQINEGYHKEVVGDKRFFTDARWQLEQCWKMYKGGVTFYGKKHIWKTKKHFTCE